MTLSRFRLTKWQHFLALGFGSGLAKTAPGTVGTLVAVPIVALLMWLGSAYLLGFIMLGTLLGIYVCEVTTIDIGQPDHAAIVWDEIIGFAITMFLVPLTWQYLLLGFLLFRLFDIAKPWPIRWFDKTVHGGLGIMLDDVVAGIAACVSVHLIITLISGG
ncbi:phosphatidylglycerophosphatase A family protein [Rheinheimera salexigens]|uniref:Phosphatidylglycerophosphatase A n=1 Tax=Rheinheimera salexigens TaxID=1628148 RepID=A0A1E7Q549_9GAMM|nr:phosphatidylglycerophosphatase A [Rheinheimera salexigens]OEY69312.1 phosphatidylglycerophosphatase [Rheinheimera salexigens]